MTGLLLHTTEEASGFSEEDWASWNAFLKASGETAFI